MPTAEVAKKAKKRPPPGVLHGGPPKADNRSPPKRHNKRDQPDQAGKWKCRNTKGEQKNRRRPKSRHRRHQEAHQKPPTREDTRHTSQKGPMTNRSGRHVSPDVPNSPQMEMATRPPQPSTQHKQSNRGHTNTHMPCKKQKMWSGTSTHLSIKPKMSVFSLSFLFPLFIVLILLYI